MKNMTMEKKKLRKKIHKYITQGRVKSLKTIYKDNRDMSKTFKKTLNENFYLHECCRTGESGMARLLYKLGAKLEVLDKNNNTPLHVALNFVLTSHNKTFFYNTVSYLFGKASDSLMTIKNKHRETVEELFSETVNVLLNEQNAYLIESDTESETEEDWNKKLFFEMEADNNFADRFADMEHADTYGNGRESFADWGDRIRSEYYQKKHPPKPEKLPRKKALPPQPLFETSGPSPAVELRKKIELLKMREQYENNIQSLFQLSKYNEKLLSFNAIPWPCDLKSYKDYTLENMNEVVSEMVQFLRKGFSNVEDEIKYLKKQQIRWHPDKFVQKLGAVLLENDRELILAYVKTLSQSINATLNNLKN